VPFDHADSNAKLISETIQSSSLPLSTENFKFMDYSSTKSTMDEMVADVANIETRYAEIVDSVLPNGRNIDLCLLGMGEDGHTCSLFPVNLENDLKPSVGDAGKMVSHVVNSPKAPPTRYVHGVWGDGAKR